MNSAAINSSETAQSATAGLKLRTALAVLLALAGLAGIGRYSWVETLTLGGAMIALYAGLFVFRGAANMARAAHGRLWLAGFFAAAVILIAPVFQRRISDLKFSAMSLMVQIATGLFIVAAVLLMILGRRRAPGLSASDASLATRIEAFVAPLSVRVNLALLAVLVVMVGLGLSGLPFATLLPRAAVIAAVVLALDALLGVAAQPGPARVLSGAVLFVLAVNFAAGCVQYSRLWSNLAEAENLLKANEPEPARVKHEQAAAINKILNLHGARLTTEIQAAEFHERIGSLRLALEHWSNVADMLRIDRAEYLPVQRLNCKLGDSVIAFRRLIRDGFSAITHPELVQGVKALGDIPGGDLRGKLLSALLAWEQNAPQDEIRRRLEAVQAQSKFEPTSFNLLKRMKAVTAEPAELWLPNDLLVGSRPTLSSVLGNIEDLGELNTLVVLDEGSWELGLKARGTPLKEEWPIVVVELDGHEVGRSQVNRAADHEVPFTFRINRGNLYRLKIRLLNYEQQLEQGRIKTRGLYIHGLSFRHGKD